VKSLCISLLAIGTLLMTVPGRAEIDEDQLGAWYMYIFDAPAEAGPWGFQGDIQYRDWELLGDLEQLLVRGGVTWRPDTNDALLTLGLAHITSGEFGPGDATTDETRIYQEAALPQKIGSRLYLRHRFRYEQRWVDDQDFRTRFRYGLFANIPLNRTDLREGAWYLSFYNEIFINGERDIGNGRTVERFDRNRFYAALGYSLSDSLKLQAGFMQQDTDDSGKPQFQLSVHQTF
jgi:hypothetical protein